MKHGFNILVARKGTADSIILNLVKVVMDLICLSNMPIMSNVFVKDSVLLRCCSQHRFSTTFKKKKRMSGLTFVVFLHLFVYVFILS